MGMHLIGDPPIAMNGRFIILDKVRSGWHVVFLENDRPVVLREIPFDSFVVAKIHARLFAEMYEAEYVPEIAR